MTRFTLSARARRDVAGIITDLHVNISPAAADAFENRLFAALHEIVRSGGAGHRRPQLTKRDVLFEFVPPYFIIFEKRRDLLYVNRVLHRARDISKLL